MTDLGTLILSSHGEYHLFVIRDGRGGYSLRPVMMIDGKVIWEDSLPPIQGIESGSNLFKEVFGLLEWFGLVPEEVEWEEVIEKLNRFQPGLGDDFERDEYESIHWTRLDGQDQETD